MTPIISLTQNLKEDVGHIILKSIENLVSRSKTQILGRILESRFSKMA